MPIDPVTIKAGDETYTLTEENAWVCIFREAPWINHVYIHGPMTAAMFECQTLVDAMAEAGFPTQVRRLPLAWDLAAYDTYIAHQTLDLIEQDQETT